MMRRTKQWISGLICLALIATSLPSTVRAADAPTLDAQLQILIRRAKAQGTAGTPKGLPSDREIKAAERALLQRKSDIETALKAHDGVLIPAQVLPVINAYFNFVTSALVLRVSMGMPHDKSFRDRFALRLPKRVMDQLPGFVALGANSLGDQFFPLSMNATDEETILRISPTLAQGIEVGTLAARGGEADFLAMLQFLSIHELILNLDQIANLKSDHRPIKASVPEELRKKLASFADLEKIRSEQRSAGIEPALRKALADAASKSLRDLPPLNEFLAEGLETIFKAAECPLPETALRPVSSAEATGAIATEIDNLNLLLTQASRADIRQGLKGIVANTMANLSLGTIITATDSTEAPLNFAARADIVALLDAKKAEYESLIPDETVDRWLANARAKVSSIFHDQARSRFLKDLLKHSATAEKLLADPLPYELIAESVQLRELNSLHEADIIGLKLGNAATPILDGILGASDYAKGRKAYADAMAKALGKAVLKDGIVDPKIAKQRIKAKQFSVEVPEGMDPAVAHALSENMTASREHDLKGLLKVGEWFGFHRKFKKAIPVVGELIPEDGLMPLSKPRRDYFKGKLKNTVMAEYPILGTEIDKVPLFKHLAALGKTKADRQTAENLLDVALEIAQQKTQELIVRVGQAKTLSEIETLTNSPLILELILNVYPEFRDHELGLVEKLKRTPILTKIMHHYVGPYIGISFGSTMLLHGASWATGKIIGKRLPFVDSILSSNFVRGLLYSAMALIIPDTLFQGKETLDLRKSANDAAETAKAGVTSRHGGFVTYSQKEAMAKGYSWSRGMLIGRLVMDTAFMYIPVGRELIPFFRKAGGL